MEDSKIYLVFEFMAMDLRKYMDVHVLGNGEQMDRMLIKSYLHQVTFTKFDKITCGN